MSQPPHPDGSTEHRIRARGAIRTHLGRKRIGARGRGPGEDMPVAVRHLADMRRSEQERAFDRLKAKFLAAYGAEEGPGAFDRALDAACASLVGEGFLGPEVALQLRAFLRRDLLQRDHPAMTFASGEITGPGTLCCESCAWTIIADRTTLLPACPQCGETSYRKTD